MPTITKTVQVISRYLYEYRSTIGPNTSDPTRIPRGSSDVKYPASIPSSWKFVTNVGRMEPSVIITIPKSNIPMHAAENTLLKLYQSVMLV
jgi:hypothetical protein